MRRRPRPQAREVETSPGCRVCRGEANRTIRSPDRFKAELLFSHPAGAAERSLQRRAYTVRRPRAW